MNKIILVLLVITYVKTESFDRKLFLEKDPSLWPGHLEPFASKQKQVAVKELDHWPDPIVFFRDYVDANKPVLFKGVVKNSLAYSLFDDDYLKNFNGSDEAFVYAEPEKKENRTKQGKEVSFKEFIEKYHNEPMYMVNALPKELQKDVTMPPPLKCEETRELMSSQVTWFSSGGTKSVIHNDDVDNINCLYRGTKHLIFVDYNKYKDYVTIDRPEGGYSSIDVDRVDYTKFPELRLVEEYVTAVMEEGDCLFIPYHWYHQVNSKANENGQNLAINVWFNHVHNHRPIKCDIPDKEATLDKYRFPDDEMEQKERGEAPDFATLMSHLSIVVDKVKKGLDFGMFAKVISKNSVFNRDKVKVEPLQNAFMEIVEPIFNRLDMNEDDKLDELDLQHFHQLDEEELEGIAVEVNRDLANVEDFFEDIVERRFQEELRKKKNEKTEL